MLTFRLSLRALSHPLSLAAIGLLLLNDHVLKAAAPSWLTGKLSDFAGLFFFPFLVIACLSMSLVARRRPPGSSTTWVPRLAFAITFIWFAAIKTWPTANAATAQVAGWALQAPVFFAPDATDVIALASLVPSWLLWRRLEQTTPAFNSDQLPAPKAGFGSDWKGLAALALASVATIATSPCSVPPIVKQVTVVDGRVYVGTSGPYSVELQYTVIEGDYANPAPTGDYQWIADQLHKTIIYPLVACEPSNPQICYRIGPPDQVEESSDHGATWQISWRVPEARRTYIARYARSSSCPGSNSLDAGPYDLAFVERTNGWEVVVAMGGQGLLVRTVDGEWHRREILGARPVPWEAGNLYLILPEPLAGTGVAWLILLAFAAVAARPLPKQRRWAAAAIITGAGLGMILWPVFSSPSFLSLAPLIGLVLCWPVLLGGLLLGLAQIAAVFGAGRAMQSLVVVSVVAAVNYGGFNAWTQGYIAQYEVAAGLAILVSLAILLPVARSTRHWQKLTSASN